MLRKYKGRKEIGLKTPTLSANKYCRFKNLFQDNKLQNLLKYTK